MHKSEFHFQMNEIICGSVAGVSGIVCTQPLDTIRIRLATQSSKSKLYNGILDCMRVTFRKEGFRGLYKGVASPCVTMGIMNAVLFFSYEGTLKLIQKKQVPNFYEVYAAGFASGTATCIINSPCELIKCLAQVNVNNKGYIREEWEICKKLFWQGGLRQSGLGRGFGITLVRDSLSYGTYFVIYEYLARKGERSKLAIFMAGGFAGAIAWASIYPLECFKSRWQTGCPETYTRWKDFLRMQIEMDGIGFFRQGFWATVARAWPQNAVLFFTYELCQSMFFGRSQTDLE